MSDEDLKQRLSLLIDGGLDSVAAMKVMRALESDPESAAAYERYLLIGELLRSNGKVVYDARFVERVHQALEAEPRLLTPMWKSARRDRIVTLALAATLAGLAVLVGQSVVRQSDLNVSGVVKQARHDDGVLKPSDVDAYLVNHSGTGYLAANGGLLPYLRVVSHGASGR